MSNYLVTGAAGFIGGALSKSLISRGHNVVTIDNLSTGFRSTIPNDVIFIQGNCQDIKIIEKLYSYQFDAIFHIAGQSSGEISFDDPKYDLQTNTQSTLLLLEYALKTNCRKFIYASTMSVYGDQLDVPISEQATTCPKSFYAVGKLASENYLNIYSNNDMDVTSLRLFNVYGPGQNLENMKQGMVSIFLASALNDKRVLVKGSPNRYRDFVYIDDVIDSFNRLLNSKKIGYRCYNVSTGVRTTIVELIDKIKDHLCYEIKVDYQGSTKGDQFGIYGDSKKINKDLGWQSKVDLDKGLGIMISWAKQLKNQ